MLDRIWKRYDSDNNKQLDQQEMYKFVKEVFGSKITVKRAREIFS